MKLKSYLVIGLYSDDLTNRFATTVRAESPGLAEQAAAEECERGNDANLIVAGTIEVPDGQELTMVS